MTSSLLKLAAVAVVLAGPAWAAPRPKSDPKPETELKRMQGKWTYRSQAIGGRELSQDRLEEIWMEIEGDLMKKAGGVRYKVTLDSTTNPKSIDLVSHEHPSGKTFVHKGIYEWDLEFLRMCFDNTGKERPKEFHAPERQDNIYMSVLKRKGK